MKLRNSKRRNEILRIVSQSRQPHLTVEDVYLEVRKSFPGISLGTVYRNLHQLAENGEILEIQFGKNPAVFELASSPHPHFYCTSCKTLFNLEVPIDGLIKRGVEKSDGHRVEEMDIFIRGICKLCLERTTE